MKNEEITAQKLSAMTDGELTEWAARRVLNWHPDGRTWKDESGTVKHMRAIGDTDLEQAVCMFEPAAYDESAFILVDEIIAKGLLFEMAYLKQDKKWLVDIAGPDGNGWKSLSEISHPSRARAITEAATWAVIQNSMLPDIW